MDNANVMDNVKQETIHFGHDLVIITSYLNTDAFAHKNNVTFKVTF